MTDTILLLVPCGLFGFIGYIVWIISKLIVTRMICKHPELSDKKVECITHMISKNNH